MRTLTTALALTLAFAACGDDTPTPPDPVDVRGTYTLAAMDGEGLPLVLRDATTGSGQEQRAMLESGTLDIGATTYTLDARVHHRTVQDGDVVSDEARSYDAHGDVAYSDGSLVFDVADTFGLVPLHGTAEPGAAIVVVSGNDWIAWPDTFELRFEK